MKPIESEIDVIAFGAHPDDVELHCSGFLLAMKKKGYSTGVIDLTRGELSTRGTTKTRLSETDKASQLLELDIRQNLSLPDGYLEVCEEHKKPIVSAIRQYRPQIVLAPYWKERHSDHIKTSQLVTEASYLAGVRKYDSQFDAYRPQRVIYYHSYYRFEPSFLSDISHVFNTKIAAIKAYESQFNSQFAPEQTFISSTRFLENIITEMRYWGAQIQTAYAEPFYLREPVRVDDPIDTWGLK